MADHAPSSVTATGGSLAVGYAENVTHVTQYLAPGPLDRSARQRHLAAYLDAAAATTGRHPYPSPFGEDEPLPLVAVYVRQFAEEQGPDPVRAGDATGVPGIGEPGPTRDRPEPGAVEAAAAARRPVPAESVLEGRFRLRVLLAAAGGGKSALLSLALSAGVVRAGGTGPAGDSGAPGPGRAPARVPVLVRARDLVRAARLPEALALVTAEELGPFGLHEPPGPEFFAAPPEPGTGWLVLVDGLDEVADRSARRGLLERLDREAARTGSPYSFVVATRPLPGSELAAVGPGADCYELRPFTAADLRTYARSCFRALPSPERHVVRFAAALKAARLETLALTPLMASMLCRLYVAAPGRALPDGRSAVYEHFVELLFEQNAHKGVRRTHDEAIRALKDRHQIPRDQRDAERAAEYVRDELPSLVDRLAYEWITGSTDSAVRLLARLLEVERPARIREPVWLAFLGDLLRPVGLLTERSGDFTFLHRTLLEFHAARHATRDEAARRRLVAELFDEGGPVEGRELLARVRSQRGDASYTGFLLDQLMSARDDVTEAALRAVEELAVAEPPSAVLILYQQSVLRTALPPHRTGPLLARIARTSEYANSRIAAAAVLAVTEGHREEGAGCLADLAADPELRPAQRLKAAQHLRRLANGKEAGDRALLAMVRDPALTPETRSGAAVLLAANHSVREEIHAVFTPYARCTEAYRTRDYDRIDAAGALAAHGHEPARLMLLRIATGAWDIRVQMDAGHWLARLGDVRVAPALRQLARVEDPEGDIWGHVRAARALSILEGHQDEGAAALVRIAENTEAWDRSARVEAVEFLAQVEGHRRAALALLQRLTDEHGVGHHARRALAKLRTHMALWG